MRSAGDIGVGHSLQVPHIHVLLVAPLGTGDMAEPGADQHQRRVPIWEAAYYAGPPLVRIRVQCSKGKPA